MLFFSLYNGSVFLANEKLKLIYSVVKELRVLQRISNYPYLPEEKYNLYKTQT